MRRWLIGCLGLLLFGLLLAPEAQGQQIRLSVEAVPLAEALRHLRDQTDVNLIYVESLIADRTATCSYTGEDLAAALACLLNGTGLVARPQADAAFIIVAGPRPPPQPQTPKVARLGTLSGFVTDATSGELLPGAHIYLNARRMGTITNEAGYFALPALPDDAYLVTISYLGYERLDTLLFTDGSFPTLKLTPAILPGTSVVVESTRKDQADRATVPGVVQVPVSVLEQFPSSLGGKDLFQALQWMPGIQQSGEVRGGLVVRGSPPDQNLYLLEGAPIYHPWHAFNFISTFQTETFKDIRLYRGSFPARHGGRLSAVLEAELKDGTREQPKAVAALNTLSGRFLIETPVTESVSFMLSGRGSFLEKLIGREHAVVDDGGRRDTLRTGYYFYDWSAKVSIRPDRKRRLSFSYYRGADVLDLRLPFDLSLDFSSWLRPADLFFEVGQRWGNQLYSFRYHYVASPRLFITVGAYESEYSAREATFIQPTSSASVTSAYEVFLRDLGLKIDTEYYFSLSHKLQVGVQAVQRQFRSMLDARVELSPGTVDDVTQNTRLNNVELVAYLQDDWQPSERWQIQPGLRFSYFGTGPYSYITPRLNVQYIVRPERLLLRGAIGTQVQYLQRLRDRHSFLYDLVSSRWIPASKSAPPSTSVQAGIGAEAFPTPWLTLSADVYWRSADDILLPEDAFQTKDGLEGPGVETGTLLGQYTSGQARAYGIELAAQVTRGPWRIWTSYTGGRSFNRAPSLGESNFRPGRFDLPRAFQALIQRTGRKWHYGASVVLRSGYPLTVPVARYALAEPLDPTPTLYLYRPYINNGRLPPYFRLDATLGYRFNMLGAKWSAEIQVYNVLNRRNVIGRQYDPATNVVSERNQRDFPLLPLIELVMEL